MQSIISIDYLQLYCDATYLDYAEEFTAEAKDYGTKNFEILEEIYLQGSLFATVQRKPRSKILQPYAAIIKFENSLLYYTDAQLIITNFLHQCQLSIISITRIDIAVDFKKFQKGLLPQNLIKGFMKEKYLKNGRGKYTIIGNQKNALDVSYLRFGTKSSDVNVYLYNKSLEMREKVFKPYISEQWKQLAGSPLEDVWRLEFSLTAKATMFLNEETGEIEDIDLSILSKNELKKVLVSALENRYFEFKINDGQANKSRMKRLQLLGLKSTGFTNRYMPSGTDIYKRDKVLMKNIYTIDKEHRNVPPYILEAKNLIIDYMQSSEYLKEYFEKMVEQWNKTKFR